MEEIPHDDVSPHVINTVDNTYIDEEEEILQVLPAGNWCAIMRGVDGKLTIPLAVWVALDTGEMYGVAPRSGEKNIDLTRNISEDPQFQTYQLVKGDR